jgi:hypothetical protein
MIDHTEDLFPDRDDVLVKKHGLVRLIHDEKPPTFLCCKACNEVIAKRKRVSATVGVPGDNSRRLWVLDDWYSFKKIRLPSIPVEGEELPQPASKFTPCEVLKRLKLA